MLVEYTKLCTFYEKQYTLFEQKCKLNEYNCVRHQKILFKYEIEIKIN